MASRVWLCTQATGLNLLKELTLQGIEDGFSGHSLCEVAEVPDQEKLPGDLKFEGHCVQESIGGPMFQLQISAAGLGRLLELFGARSPSAEVTRLACQ